MTTTMETTDRCSIEKIDVGSVWTRHDSGKVTGIRGDMIDLKNDQGDEWQITADLVRRQFSFADQAEEAVKITRTEMIRLIKSNPRTAMTVIFHKKPDAKNIASQLANGQGDLTDRKWNSHVKKLIQGEERVMIGHHYGSFDEHQRLHFKEAGKGNRLVDLRTVTNVTVNRVSYSLK